VNQRPAFKEQLIDLKKKNGFNMRISTMKTKTMAFQGKDHIRRKIVIDNKTIEQVSSFKYLGFNVLYCLKEDINIKLNKFQRMCGTIRRTLRQKTLQSTQLKFYNIMAVPMLTYASKNWTINQSDKKKIESAEIKFLAGYTLLDQKRSTDICSELKIFNLTERIEKQKENWHEHILRMTADRLPKVLLNYKPRGYRNVGRPMARWEDACILLKSETGLWPVSFKKKKNK
jgi:hypothetical protein